MRSCTPNGECGCPLYECCRNHDGAHSFAPGFPSKEGGVCVCVFVCVCVTCSERTEHQVLLHRYFDEEEAGRGGGGGGGGGGRLAFGSIVTEMGSRKLTHETCNAGFWLHNKVAITLPFNSV